jgi:hypothetical protein
MAMNLLGFTGNRDPTVVALASVHGDVDVSADIISLALGKDHQTYSLSISSSL